MALFKCKAKPETKKEVTEKSNEKLMRRLIITAAIIALVVGAVAVARPSILYAVAGHFESTGNTDAAYDIYVILDDYKESKDKAWNIKYTNEINALLACEIGDVVTFGTYEQDNVEKNGPEDIEWYVLDKQEDRVFLLTKDLLDNQPYNTTKEATTWEKCSLRGWLNETFYAKAFHADEQAHIEETRVLAEKNPDFNTRPGKSTRDKLFLLSNSESLTYITSRTVRSATTSEYAIANGGYRNLATGTGYWWLRTPGKTSEMAEYVYYHGYIEAPGNDVDKTFYGVRPAMWVNISVAEDAE